MSEAQRTGFLAIALALFAAARFRSGHYRSGWLCIAASVLLLVDGFAFSLFVSLLAGGMMVAAALAIASDTLSRDKAAQGQENNPK